MDYPFVYVDVWTMNIMAAFTTRQVYLKLAYSWVLYNNFTSRVFGEIVSMFLITGDDFCSMLTSKCIYSPKDIRI
jgi:hypothetical protein